MLPRDLHTSFCGAITGQSHTTEINHGIHIASAAYAFDALEPYIDAKTMESITTSTRRLRHQFEQGLEGTIWATSRSKSDCNLDKVPSHAHGVPIRGGHATLDVLAADGQGKRQPRGTRRTIQKD